MHRAPKIGALMMLHVQAAVAGRAAAVVSRTIFTPGPAAAGGDCLIGHTAADGTNSSTCFVCFRIPAPPPLEWH